MLIKEGIAFWFNKIRANVIEFFELINSSNVVFNVLQEKCCT